MLVCAKDALSVFSVSRHKVTKLKIDEFAENFSAEENPAVAVRRVALNLPLCNCTYDSVVHVNVRDDE